MGGFVAPRPAAAPWRLDRATHGALQRLALQVLLACGGFFSVWLVMNVARARGPVSAPWQLWLALFPLALLLMPTRDDHRFTDARLVETLRHIGQALNVACAVLVLQAALWASGAQPLPWSLLAAILLVQLTLGAALRALVRALAALTQPPLRIVVVGADAQGCALAQYLRQRGRNTEVVGFVDDRIDRVDRAALSAPYLGGVARLAGHHADVDAAVIAIPNDATERLQTLANTLRNGRMDVYLAPAVPLLNSGHPHLARGDECLQDLVLLGMKRLPLAGRALKRAFDVAFSCVALVMFLPVGLVIAALIKMESPGPVFFRQARYGAGNRLFEVFKFRSMRFDPVAEHGEIRLTERGDARVTHIGDFLRRTSLDEFPQFMNVLMGDMSVVGPRPHPPGVKAGSRIYEDVVADFMERYKVRPGITGWAQVNGLRGNTFTEEDLTRRFASDVEYIRNWSFELDLWIVLKTVWGGFAGKNAF